MERLLRYSGYTLLIFGLLYFTWHMGRYYENRQSAELVNPALEICEHAAAECSAITDSYNEVMHEFIILEELYKEVLNELQKPTSPEEWQERYKEFTEKKIES